MALMFAVNFISPLCFASVPRKAKALKFKFTAPT